VSVAITYRTSERRNDLRTVLVEDVHSTAVLLPTRSTRCGDSQVAARHDLPLFLAAEVLGTDPSSDDSAVPTAQVVAQHPIQIAVKARSKGLTMITTQTKAETKACQMAKYLEDAGFEIKITVVHHSAEHYSDGSVMLPERVSCGVMAHGPKSADGGYGLSFMTWLPAEGRRTRTHFTGASEYRPWKPRRARSSIRKLTLRQLRFCIGSEMDSARYGTAREEARRAGALNCTHCLRVIGYNVAGTRWFHQHNDFENFCGACARPSPCAPSWSGSRARAWTS